MIAATAQAGQSAHSAATTSAIQSPTDFTQSRIVHAVTGGTGIYRGARGEFSFTSPSPGVLDMTLTLLP